ncbi:UDP-2,4-diacetamido-2,4,6-trideoxy-beta-L-altropyranose hydrolase, partial [uncultured Hymenobacter sp.]|uniref:UDP-2,4-diacetamido-2,4, 6-trideoxy-beta-L-altropyranose hydrolase n=1 Tax=uncultured Hymenobacter sp. TaxID=170016 RepID=UPI0035C97F09
MAGSLPQVVFRADANQRIGLGHLMRCLALAEMLHQQFACRFIIRDSDSAIQDQILASGFTYDLVPSGLTLLEEATWLQQQVSATTILVLDGYDFDDAYRRELKRTSRALICLDDMGTQHSWCDVIVNAAGGITRAFYSPEPGATLCLGPAYALLRRPFREAALRPTHQPDTKRIFLNMGGADPHNHTLLVLKQLQQRFPERKVAVVTGAAYPHQQILNEYAAHKPAVRLYHNLSAAAMAELLASCGIFVCPPSGMAYECCALGGLLLLYPTAENQRRILDFLVNANLALLFPSLPTLVDNALPDLASAMQIRQRAIFDGAAAQRYQQVFAALHLTYSLSIRRATTADMRLYFTWANEARVRQQAVHTAPIAWSSHQAWFTRRLT